MAFRRFAAMMLAGQPIPVYGDGSTTRDYTYISDVVDGIVAALDCALPYGVFNIGNSRRHALIDCIHLLAEALGVEPKLEFLPEQPGDPPHTCADITAAQTALSYAPKVELPDGLRCFADWLAQNAA
jgi:UDP-glucuronate 4-epimerase